MTTVPDATDASDATGPTVEGTASEPFPQPSEGGSLRLPLSPTGADRVRPATSFAARWDIESLDRFQIRLAEADARRQLVVSQPLQQGPASETSPSGTPSERASGSLCHTPDRIG